MPKLVALTLTIGVLAVAATWLFGLPQLTAMKLQVWQAFIAWGCHFQSGGKLSGTRGAAVCMSFGAVVGMCAALAIPQLGSLGNLAAPVAVGVGAALIVVASTIPLLQTIPACFYGFAVIFALIGLKAVDTPTAALLPTVLSCLIGAAFGFVSEVVTDVLSKKPVAAAAAAA